MRKIMQYLGYSLIFILIFIFSFFKLWEFFFKNICDFLDKIGDLIEDNFIRR